MRDVIRDCLFGLGICALFALLASVLHAEEAPVGDGGGVVGSGEVQVGSSSSEHDRASCLGPGCSSSVRAGSHDSSTIAIDPSIDIEDRDLADRALAWVMHRRDAAFRFDSRTARLRGWPDRDWVRDGLVPAAIEAAQGAQFPERWPDAEVLIAKAWWESRWRPAEVGRYVTVNGRAVRGTGGELGVMQIKPRICARYMQPGEDCADTRVNLRIAATILREHLEACPGRPGYALRFYATGNGCGTPRRPEKTVMRWADHMRHERLD